MSEIKGIQKTLKLLPRSPGIYKMIDKEGKVLYIGKAKDIQKRVKQYFKKGYAHSNRTQKLVENICDIKATATDNELEAIILETNLIKQLQPKYNILMKDDKNYVYIKITNEDFPRIQIVRKIEKDGAKYIGPKTAAHKVKATFNVIKKLFPFRHCGLDIEMMQENPPGSDHKVKVSKKVIKYPCIDFYIKRCIAPCIGKCDTKQYQEIVKNAENFLEGKVGNILKDLYAQMKKLAKEQKFEKAARLRDKIKKVEDILKKQKVSDPNQEDKDIINYCITHNRAFFNLFQIRDGKLTGQENFILNAQEIEESESKEALQAFLNQYYQIATDIPKEILIPHELENKAETQTLISKQRQKKAKIIIPKRGDKNKLLEMSLNNARIFADRNKASWQEESELTKKAAEDLQKLLKVTDPLKRIECYDISHLSGTDTVGSMIVFEKGVPKNKLYRKFKLRTVQGKPDDYKSMEEVLKRRFLKIAQDIKHEEYKFKKARKKDKVFIESNNKIKLDKTDRSFFILEKGKKIVGFTAIKEFSKNVTELSNLYVSKSERGHKIGYKLVKEAIKKTKSKRIYGFCKEELKDYYFLFGFEEIRKIPKELGKRHRHCKKERGKVIPIVYDKNKHKQDESFSKIPNLVIIDGGKGQLSAATKVFEELNLQIPYIALAKKLEEIHRPNSKNPITLPKTNEALKLLQRARDEAHRFAISYNKNLRSKKFKK